PNVLWVSIIKTIHGGDVGLGTLGCFMNGVWAAILGSINSLHSVGILLKGTLRHKVGLHEDCYIHDRWSPNGWIRNWRRPVENDRIRASFSSILVELQNITLTDNLDSWFWQIGKDGVYRVGDTRRHIDDHILPSIVVSTIWNKSLPRGKTIVDDEYDPYDDEYDPYDDDMYEDRFRGSSRCKVAATKAQNSQVEADFFSDIFSSGERVYY
ncbi:hypothetical protein Tco_0959159, partial [Tanacetum coccineum]